MATEGMIGLYVETRSYAATTALWAALGYEPVFATDHGSGQWVHPAGGPYVFIAEQHERDVLETHPILGVADASAFAPAGPVELSRPFTPQHWGVTEALVRDPDGRELSLQAPLPDGVHGDHGAHGHGH